MHYSQLLIILKQIDIDDKDFCIIHNLHYEQKAAIKPTEGLAGWTDIKRGVRQGYVTSPDFFNLYREFIPRELEKVEEGIQVNSRRINNIYVNKTMLLASSEVGFKVLLNAV